MIIPTLNERDNVQCVVDMLSEVLDGLEWEVVFVDDDSPDGTADVVRQVGQGQLRVRCVQRIRRRGLSTACIEGMLASNAPYLAVMDGDLQHDPALLRKMFDILTMREAELVVGSRYVDGGGCGDWSSGRRRISQLGTSIGRWLLAQDLKDPMSTFFAVRRNLLDESVRGISGRGFKILLDMMLTLRRPVRFVELPYILRERHAGESKFDLRIAWEYVLLLAEKTIGRYLPVRFVSPTVASIVGSAVQLGILMVAHGAIGGGFSVCETVASVLSVIVTYVLGTAGTRDDPRKPGLNWFSKLLSLVVIGGAGATINFGVAEYLFGRGTAWFLAAAAGALTWVVWNCAASTYSSGHVH